jgi:hypothetical protein
MESTQADVGRALSALGGGTVWYRTFPDTEKSPQTDSRRGKGDDGQETQSSFPLLAAALPRSADLFRDPAGPPPIPPEPDQPIPTPELNPLSLSLGPAEGWAPASASCAAIAVPCAAAEHDRRGPKLSLGRMFRVLRGERADPQPRAERSAGLHSLLGKL